MKDSRFICVWQLVTSYSVEPNENSNFLNITASPAVNHY